MATTLSRPATTGDISVPEVTRPRWGMTRCLSTYNSKKFFISAIPNRWLFSGWNCTP